MPWHETNALDQPNEFIGEWLERERPIAELSRIYVVSRRTAYKWLERFRQSGRAGLADRSRAPHHRPQAIDEETAATTVAERQNRPTWGARKMLQSLKRQQPEEAWPADSGIGELLKRKGLIQARRARRRTSSGVRISKVGFVAATGPAATRSR